MRTQKGFTLIELLMVLVILGIVFMFAASAYQNYALKTKAYESVKLLDTHKKVIEAFYAEYGHLPHCDTGMPCPTFGTLQGSHVRVQLTGTANYSNLTSSGAVVDALPEHVGYTYHLLRWDENAGNLGEWVQFGVDQTMNYHLILTAKVFNGGSISYGVFCNNWRDPRPQYNGPQESGLDPRNPARYLAPRQLLWGIAFKF